MFFNIIKINLPLKARSSSDTTKYATLIDSFDIVIIDPTDSQNITEILKYVSYEAYKLNSGCYILIKISVKNVCSQISFNSEASGDSIIFKESKLYYKGDRLTLILSKTFNDSLSPKPITSALFNFCD